MAKGDSGQTNSGPWAPTQSYIKQTLGAAQNFYNAGQGFNPGPWQDYYTQPSGFTKQGIAGLDAYGKQGDPLAGQSQGAISGILGSGGGINTAGALGGLVGQGQNLYGQASNP